MGIDNSGNLKPPVPFEHKIIEKLSGLREKVEDIFSKRGLHRQTSKQTLEELAAIEIPQDQNPELPPSVDQPPETVVVTLDTTPQDQSEIAQLIQSIQDISSENQSPLESAAEAPKPPERTLFPDRPSLDELIAQDPNRKTKVSFLTRQKDIRDLKKSGVTDASQVYDSLIKKGVPRGLILETKGQIVDYGQYGLYMKHYAAYEDELKTKEGQKNRKSDIQQLKKIVFVHDIEKFYDRLRVRGLSRGQFTETLNPDKRIYYGRQLPEIMDKLYSVNLLDEITDIGPQDLFINLSFQSNEDFQKRREEIKPLFFLKPDDLPELFSPSISQESNPFISWFSQNFLNGDNKDDAFSETIHQNIKTILLSYGSRMSTEIEDCLKNIILSDLNQKQVITIPDIFDQNKRSWREASNIQILNQIEDRRQQKFFVKNPNKHNFNEDGVPLVSFYGAFLSSPDFNGERIIIPEKTLLLVENNQDKIFYQNISNLKNPEFQKTCLLHTNFSYFDSEGRLTPLFYKNHLFFNKGSFITDTDISNFSEEEKSIIKLTRNVKNILDSVEYSGMNRFYSDFFSSLNQYCDQDGQPNASFFRTAFGYLYDIKEYKAFFDLLTPDRIASFTEIDKKVWKDILSITSDISNPNLLKNIVSMVLDNNKDLIFFNQDHQPTSLFFEKMLHFENLNDDYLNSVFSLLTPEVLSTFTEIDKKVWKDILSLNGSSIPVINLILRTKESDSIVLFNQDHQPTSLFFENIVNFDYFDHVFFKSNLTPEIIATFSPEDQKFWSSFIQLKGPCKRIAQIILEFKSLNIFNDNHQPTSLFFEKLGQKDFYNIDFFKSNLTPEIIATFSPEDQKFFKTISKLLDSNAIKIFYLYKNDYLSLINDDLSVNTLFLKKYITLFPTSAIPLDQNFLDHRPETEQIFWNNFKKVSENNKNPILNNLITDTGGIPYDHPFYKILSQDNPTFFSSDFTLNQEIGQSILNSPGLSEQAIFFSEISRLQELISLNPDIQINHKNWQSMLMIYIQIHTEIGIYDVLPKISNATTEKINQIFSESSVKNFCLKEFQSEWQKYLQSRKPESIPSSIYLISNFINFTDGAGPLSQIESLATLVNSVSQMLEKLTTAPRTKTEIINGLSELEARFNQEKWSNEDKTNFYNISTDIINAAPSLFSEYITLFKRFNSEELKRFNEEIYPLYKTKLVLLEQETPTISKYKVRDLVRLRQQIRSFDSFQNQKDELLSDIKNSFKDRFGLISIPETFSPESIRSIKNISSYLGNINNRDSKKETLLVYYLSLMIHDKWGAFRRGESFDASNYLSGEKKSILDPILDERQNIITTLTTTAGIDPVDSSEFIRLIQNEVRVLHLGEIETVDIKLNNIIRNLEELEDLDLYPEVIDKERMKLLQTWGNKKVGSVVARIYQQTTNPSKVFTFSEEDIQIREDIEKICQNCGINLNDPEIIKSVFQDGIKQFSVIVNILGVIKDLNVDLEIENLKQKLIPPQDIIRLFNQLGEKFATNSGVVPITQDVDYLENLIIKNETTITAKDRALASEYITSIRSQIIKLEEIYGQIKSKFENLKQGNSSIKNELLAKKLEDISKIITQSATQQPITSVATNNLNDVIENIRACLACITKGANNDTDLTFGDVNKFYLYSKTSDSQKGSISDQLVYLEPITKSNGTEVSFVIDNLYGIRTPSILEGHIDTLLRKIDQIKTRFPKSKISIFVSATALSSSGTFASDLVKKYQSYGLVVNEEYVDVDILKSSFADHYIEIANENERSVGIKKVKGIILSN